MDPIQRRIDELDAVLSATIRHPDLFADVRRAQQGLESRIALLERIQLAEMRNSRLAGRLNSKEKQNVIVPIISHPRYVGKGELV